MYARCSTGMIEATSYAWPVAVSSPGGDCMIAAMELSSGTPDMTDSAVGCGTVDGSDDMLLSPCIRYPP